MGEYLNMLQQQEEKQIKKILKEILKDDYLFVKIHGGQYQMSGLPDFLILTPGMIFWLEHKRDKSDKPKKIQKHIIEKVLKKFNIFSGYIINGFVYPVWGKWELVFSFEYLIKTFNKGETDV